MKKIEINLNAKPQICKHCNRQKGRHKAVTFNCPFGRGNFPNYFTNQFFEPKKKRDSK